MRAQSSKSKKFMKYISLHPDANVKELAAKMGITTSLGYQLRKKLREQPKREITLTKSQEAVAKKLGVSLEDYARAEKKLGKWQPPEMVPMPEVSGITDVDGILNTRAENYGKFKDGAALMQSIKRAMSEHAARHGKTFADDQWEALEMIVHKIGRIVNGNPDVVDHWVDIAGYATLIADRLDGNPR